MKYDNYLFAFLDALGFSSTVRVSEKDDLANEKVENFYSVCNAKAEWQQRVTSFQNIQTMVMSDSIIVAMPISNALTSDQIRTFCLYISKFQNELASFGIWVRGGITFDKLKLNVDDKFIVGPALVKAVEIEKNYARYPRVVVDSNILTHTNYTSFSQFRGAINLLEDSTHVLFDWKDPRYLDIMGALKQDIPLFIDFYSQNLYNQQKANQVIDHVSVSLRHEMAHFEKYRWLADYILDVETPRATDSRREFLSKLR